MRKKNLLKITLILLGSVLAGCAPHYLSQKTEPEVALIRIALSRGLPQAEVQGADTVYLRDQDHSAVIIPGQSWKLLPSSGGPMIQTSQGQTLGPIRGFVRIYSRSPFFINGREFSGPAEIRQASDNGLLLVMETELERYLLGVVSAEMGSGRQELEALKAQAVASRSYALTKIGSSPEAGYDIEAGVQHQAYDGNGNAPSLILKAVEDTRGQVLVHDGKVVAANFHSTCGGRTALPSEVWQAIDERFPFLKSAKDDHCNISPRHSWQDTVTAREMLDKLFPGQPQAKIRNIEVLERSKSDRVQALRVTAECADTVLYKDKIRSGLSA
ncbi:MAG: SpoIID/LytB domain-containing protein, partial [Deltaproteobacteria bacterium]|nr:SpoIID/LytB domain-containing protein [Deltaproteobacteria bacterium]